MNRFFGACVAASILILFLGTSPASADWPQFRGAFAAGVDDDRPLPTEWGETDGVLWKTPIPGLGHSCPVVWGDRVFVLSAVGLGEKSDALKVGLYGDIMPVTDETAHRFIVICIEAGSGKVLWERTAHEGVPKIKRHTKATHANTTAATDGVHVVAFFGSEGLYCYDFNGKELWKRDFGVLDSGFYMVPGAQWGFASSPVLHEGVVLIQADVQRDSFVAALDVKTGKEIWRTSREDVPTWSTPTVHTSAGRTQVICNGYRHIAGYDFKTGELLWTMDGGGDIPVPTPVVAHDLIFIASAHGPRAPLFAIRTDAVDDITPRHEAESSRHIPWMKWRVGIYMQTPLVYGDLLYGCRDNGVLTCFDARTGEKRYSERLGTGKTGFTASAVAGDGKLYFTSEEGEVFVVKAGPEFKLLATNALHETCLATPAISDGVLYFRTGKHLVAVGAGEQ